MKITPQEQNWLKENIEKIDFLRRLEPSQVDRLIHEFTARNIEGGETVIQQGQAGDTFFLVFNGKLGVWLEKDQQRAKLAELNPGDHFGEISLLSGKPATSTVIAKKQTRVFFLNSDVFLELVRGNPDLAKHIVSVVQKRLQERKVAQTAIERGTPVEISLEIQRFLTSGQR